MPRPRRWKSSRSLPNCPVACCNTVGGPKLWPRTLVYILSVFDDRSGPRKVDLALRGMEYQWRKPTILAEFVDALESSQQNEAQGLAPPLHADTTSRGFAGYGKD